MTKRKPPGMSFENWVDQQVQAAERQGDFDHLPGKGKPIAGLNDPHHEMTWIVNKIRSENLPLHAVLPPALALAKELEDLPALVSAQRSEKAVRSLVTDLNDRIIKAHRYPQDGPPVRVMTVEVEPIVVRWRAERDQARRESEELAAAARAEQEELAARTRRAPRWPFGRGSRRSDK